MAGKLFYISFALCMCSAFCLELKQVVILSRHNLRTPIAERLETMSPKEWLKWDQRPAQLTKKGAVLEGYLAEYFAEWLRYQGLLPEGCPDEDSVQVYANTRQRTKDTAQAFVGSAFRNCNIKVKSENMAEMDPVFRTIINNTTEAFREQVFAEMNQKLEETDLKNVYAALDRIIDFKNSQICKEMSQCDLVNDKVNIVYQVGMEPNVDGPLLIGNSVVDAFLMGYYEGFPLNDIAWGEIQNVEELESLTSVVKDYQSVRYHLPKSSKHFARPLVKYIKEMFSSNKTVTLLVGHDSNLNSVISALGFDLFTLPGQREISPIGAKLVFQRWSDGDNDFLKVEYVYTSAPQIRNTEKLTLSNPPKNITMYLKDLSNRNGFYDWNDFESRLQDVTE